MAGRSKKTVTCDQCAKVECRSKYPEGIPAYCVAAGHREALEKSRREYKKPLVSDIYLASGRLVRRGATTYTRVQEAIEFCRELKYKKVGLASCLALLRELTIVAKLFRGAGFEAVSANCQVGRVSPSDRIDTLTPEEFAGLWCNPIAQAEIMNAEGTDMNFLIGLCLGHDVLFNRYSKAPVSTLIVKDRVLGHNPAAALWAYPHQGNLAKLYCKGEPL